MRNQMVPRNEWPKFFDKLSRRHQGSLATVRVFGPRIGSQVEARNLPLGGFVCAVGSTSTISIHLGSAPPQSHIEHEIDQPKQVWVEMSDEGVEEVLEVESMDGTKTMIQLTEAR